MNESEFRLGTKKPTPQKSKKKPTKKPYYMQLKRAMFEKGISVDEIADFLYMDPGLLYNRMCGRTKFTLDEAIKIKQEFFPEIPIEELFYVR